MRDSWISLFDHRLIFQKQEAQKINLLRLQWIFIPARFLHPGNADSCDCLKGLVIQISLVTEPEESESV